MTRLFISSANKPPSSLTSFRATFSSFSLSHSFPNFQSHKVGHQPTMINDAAFRSSVAWLAAIIIFVGLYTLSFKKMLATYWFGMFAICGVLLPDWEFFDRSISQWCTPVNVDTVRSLRSSYNQNAPMRFKVYPIRMMVYSIVYGCAFYKWWNIVSK